MSTYVTCWMIDWLLPLHHMSANSLWLFSLTRLLLQPLPGHANTLIRCDLYHGKCSVFCRLFAMCFLLWACESEMRELFSDRILANCYLVYFRWSRHARYIPFILWPLLYPASMLGDVDCRLWPLVLLKQKDSLLGDLYPNWPLLAFNEDKLWFWVTRSKI